MSKERRYNPILWDEVKDLGKMPDTVLAEKLRVSSQAVHAARQRRGIPPFSNVGRPRLSPEERKKNRKKYNKKNRKKYRLMAKRRNWDWTLTDREMAETYKVHRKNKGPAFFNRVRRLLKIKPATVLREES